MSYRFDTARFARWQQLPAVTWSVSLLCLVPGLVLMNPAIGLAGGAVAVFLLARDPVARSSFYSKHCLQTGVVILGLTLDINQLLALSVEFSWVVAGYVLLTIGIGLTLVRLMRVDSVSGQLLTYGTAICGGTTIMTIAPLLRADAVRVATAMATVLTLNFVAVLVFPLVGEYLGVSQLQFGAFSALAVHDTSSVVATAALYGDDAAQVAATVKLGRTLWLIPLVVVVASFGSPGGSGARLQIPGFVLAFVAASAIGSLIDIPDMGITAATIASKSLLVLALFFVGVQINRETLKGLRGRTGVLAIGLWLVMMLVAAGLVALITA